MFFTLTNSSCSNILQMIDGFCAIKLSIDFLLKSVSARSQLVGILLRVCLSSFCLCLENSRKPIYKKTIDKMAILLRIQNAWFEKMFTV